MKKRAISIILSVFMLISLIPAYAITASAANSGRCGADITWEYDSDSGELLIEGTGDMYDYSNGGAPWYSKRGSIETVEISDEITSVGNYAFANFTAMTDVSIGDTVTKIGTGAFSGCASLEGVTLPSELKTIGDSAFYGCSYLEDASMPDNIQTVGVSAFENCAMLSDAEFPESVSSIGEAAFRGCSGLSSVTFPETLTDIGASAFEGCSSITELELPLQLKTVSNYCFRNCSSLETLTLHYHLETIGNYAFNGCSSLAELHFDATEERWQLITICEGNGPLDKAEKNFAEEDPEDEPEEPEEPDEKIISGQYGSGINWTLDLISGELTVTGEGSFAMPRSAVSDGETLDLTQYVISATLEDGITALENNAFYGFGKMGSISLPDTLETIGESAFDNCRSLTALEIPNGVTVIPYGMCSGCSALEYIKLPADIVSIGSFAFMNCGSAASFGTLPDDLDDIGVAAFMGCSSLAAITLPSALQIINPMLFSGCTSFEQIEIPYGATLIGTGAFEGCTALGSINMGPNVSLIESGAFSGCTNLSDIYFNGSAADRENMDVQESNEAFLNAEIHYSITVTSYSVSKLGGYDIKISGLNAANAYTIRYATGEYANPSAVKNGANAGFIQVSGVTEAFITLPTDGIHTVSVQIGAELKMIDTVTIEQTDIENQFRVSTSDLALKVENLRGAGRINLIANGSTVMKINPSSFTTDGLKTWAEFTAPSAGEYTVQIIYTDGAVSQGAVTVTVPAALLNTNGRVFKLSEYGAGNVSYIRFAKGVITTAAAMKAAPDLRTFGAKYFRDETAAFAALDAVNGETTTYTVQIGYASGYSEFITFDVTPTVPVFTPGAGTITVTNVNTRCYHIDWIRCAPGEHSSLYAIRHAYGSQVKKTEHIVDDAITFTGLSSGTYTLYYLYDGWNLSEGMVSVSVK